MMLPLTVGANRTLLYGVGRSLLTGLGGYWKQDEASGARADSLAVSNLTDNNTVASTAGKIGNAARFVAANLEYLSVADNASLSVNAATSFTIACWVRHTTLAATQTIIAKWGASNAGEYLLLYNSALSRYQLLVGNGAANNAVVANNLGAPTTGVWYFIVAGYNAESSQLFFQANNGVTDRGTVSISIADTTQPFQIGARANLTAYLDGDVDEVGFWRRVLTGAERTALFNAGLGWSYPFST
jgi:hypothetical protein